MAGRYPLNPSDRKQGFKFRLKNSDRQRLEALAEQRGIKLGQLVRTAVLEWAEQQSKSA